MGNIGQITLSLGNDTASKNDLWQQWGLLPAPEAIKAIMQFPKAKKAKQTDWAEWEGFSVSQERLMLESRTGAIDLIATDIGRAMEFWEEATTAAEADTAPKAAGIYFDSTLLACHEWQLRLTGVSSLNYLRKTGKISLSFTEDSPDGARAYMKAIAPTDYTDPGRRIRRQGVAIGTEYGGDQVGIVPLSDIGVWVLDGTEDSLKKPAALKERLITKNGGTDGQKSSAGGRGVPKSRDVVLKLLVVDDFHEAHHKYLMLFALLLRPGVKILRAECIEGELLCIYKQSSITRARPLKPRTAGGTPRLWLEFSLTLTVCKSEPPTGKYKHALSDEKFSAFIDLSQPGGQPLLVDMDKTA